MSRSNYFFFKRTIGLFFLLMTLILSGGISASKGLEIAKLSDKNNDGYGDNLTGFRGDFCPNIFGESNRNGTFGCSDGDFILFTSRPRATGPE